MDRSELYAGQIVRMEAPRAGNELVKVVKINPKKVKVVKASGEMWNVPPTFLSHATPSEVSSFTLAAPDEALVIGSVVRFTTGAGGGKLFVVCGTRAGAYKLAQLGGDGGRYYSGIAPELLEVVKFDVAGV